MSSLTRLQVRLTEVEKRVTDLQRQFDVQLVRIGQQAELDVVRNAWVKITPASRSRRSTKTHAPP